MPLFVWVIFQLLVSAREMENIGDDPIQYNMCAELTFNTHVMQSSVDYFQEAHRLNR